MNKNTKPIFRKKAIKKLKKDKAFMTTFAVALTVIAASIFMTVGPKGSYEASVISETTENLTAEDLIANDLETNNLKIDLLGKTPDGKLYQVENTEAQTYYLYTVAEKDGMLVIIEVEPLHP